MEVNNIMGFFDDLLREKPESSGNLGIRKFVREHLDQLKVVREKGYSWKQIAKVVQSRLHIPSKNLDRSLNSAYIKIKKVNHE